MDGRPAERVGHECEPHRPDGGHCLRGAGARAERRRGRRLGSVRRRAHGVTYADGAVRGRVLHGDRGRGRRDGDGGTEPGGGARRDRTGDDGPAGWREQRGLRRRADERDLCRGRDRHDVHPDGDERRGRRDRRARAARVRPAAVGRGARQPVDGDGGAGGGRGRVDLVCVVRRIILHGHRGRHGADTRAPELSLEARPERGADGAAVRSAT